MRVRGHEVGLEGCSRAICLSTSIKQSGARKKSYGGDLVTRATLNCTSSSGRAGHRSNSPRSERARSAIREPDFQGGHGGQLRLG